jgi:Ca2+-binding RTX toxin-like protein
MTLNTHRYRTATAVAALAVAAALAGPSIASADTGIAFNAGNNTITLTGDADGDQVVIADQGGLLTHSINGAAASTNFNGSTVPADGRASLVVNAGEGADTVTVTSALLQAVTIDGGPGTDVIDGSPGDDVLRGGTESDDLRGNDGDDRITGDQQGDDVFGGNGNDTLVWNNGDGSDVMDGDGGGGDEIEVNGASQADQFTLKPNPANPARTRFDRLNLVPFTLDINAERISVNGQAGNDSIVGEAGLAPLILSTLNGGVGTDAITGGDGADLITGGDDNDALAGGAGNDRIVGDRGGDGIAGGNGDDTMVWNNGDGSDKMDGEAGLDRVEVNGATEAGDAFTIAPNGGRAKFDRTNLVPFSLDIGSSEALDARGLGGNDTFAAQPGTGALLAVTADGGSGDDVLTGAEEADTFSGGTGNDQLTGGAGPDSLDGQDGDDALRARDDAGDLARGGAGNDNAQVDRVDVVDGIESLDVPAAPPAPDTKATAARIAGNSAAVRIRNGRASVRLSLSCPAAEAGGCAGSVTLFSAKAIKIGSQRVIVRLGSANYRLNAGQRRTVTVRLPKGTRKLAKNRRIATRAQTVTRDQAGNVAVGTKALSLRLPRR